MSKQRVVHTKFWSDGWVRESLNQLDRYLFLYTITNEHTNISGIYELPLSTMAFETGFNRDELLDTMLPRLSPKVRYADGWIIHPNFLKHQSLTNPKIILGITAELKKVPKEILEQAIAYGYPMDSLSHLNLNSNLNSNLNTKWFEEWWIEYPSSQRVHKELCRTKYESKLDEKEHLRRLSHLKEQKSKDRKWLGGYIPQTTTYINQDRWNQEVEPERRGQSQQVYKSKK